MASNTRLGGKAPRHALMIVIAPKSGTAAGKDSPPDSEPDADDMPSGPMSNAEKAASTPAPTPDDGTVPKPGESAYHDQRQLCSNCDFFDPDGQSGVGECMKHVPEADFSISDPDASHCKFWAAQNQRSAQSAAQTGTPTPPPTPPPNLPPAA